MKIQLDITVRGKIPDRPWSSHLVQGEGPTLVGPQGQALPTRGGTECRAYFWTIWDPDWRFMISICPHSKVHIFVMAIMLRVQPVGQQALNAFIEQKTTNFVSGVQRTIASLFRTALQVEKAKRGQEVNDERDTGKSN